MRLPTASRPRLNFFANVSLTIATFGLPSASAVGELAPGEQRHAEHVEVAGPDVVEARVVVDVGSVRKALDAHVVAPVVRSRAAARAPTSRPSRRESRRVPAQAARTGPCVRAGVVAVEHGRDAERR